MEERAGPEMFEGGLEAFKWRGQDPGLEEFKWRRGRDPMFAGGSRGV